MASFIGMLVDSEDNALGQQTVVFIVNRSDGGYSTALAAFTDPSGAAIPNLTTLPAGSYFVTAYFGQAVPGTEVDLTSQLYGPSSATSVFAVGLVFLPSAPSDSFNQPNGALSSQWLNKNPGSYRVVNNQLTALSGGPLYWKAATYGHDQGVYVTFARVDQNSSQQALLLKVQGGSQPDWQQGAIAVIYDAKQHVIQIETYQPNQSHKWTVYPSQPLTLHDGDRLGAMALANGQVRIFVNSNLIMTTTLNPADQAFFNNRGGYIGLWFKAANSAVLDDFGGGTILP
jgi:hypothetical protein